MAKNLITIKNYSDADYQEIFELAKSGRTMDQVARHLGISFRRFWIDYNNPALGVKENYDDGRDALDEERFVNLQKESSNPKNGKALIAFNQKLDEIHLRNKIHQIREQNNIWD
ncbi:hypothetical protein [uncultured Draconibacterium sp.]|uniref:hypothetical protein n=1 Tax=uncultured Draconibacterium sp. TaxID=1573823 RepID=UPI0025E15447|nr:hypothetical protein [uncultured Draconibacterium sp.]